MSSLTRSPIIMTRAMKAVIISLISAFMIFAPATAQLNQAQAESFTKTLVTELGAIAKNPSLNDDARERAYRGALQSRLATDEIGKFLLKSVPAELPTQAQIARYNQLFPTYIAASFASQIGGLAERQINVTQSRTRGERDVIVRSELVNNRGVKTASIDWRIRWINGQPRLLDVLVERVSPLVTKRQEFSSLAKRQGMDALLAHMQTVAN